MTRAPRTRARLPEAAPAGPPTQLQWYAPQAGSWLSRNHDHRYGVARCIGISVDGRATKHYEAFHIEALWAVPKSLGRADSLTEAQGMCQRHHEELTT